MKTFQDLTFKSHPCFKEGKKAYMEFPNGFGISVITGDETFGDKDHPYEAAVISKHPAYHVINSSVTSHLTEDDITKMMKKIQELENYESL